MEQVSRNSRLDMDSVVVHMAHRFVKRLPSHSLKVIGVVASTTRAKRGIQPRYEFTLAFISGDQFVSSNCTV